MKRNYYSNATFRKIHIIYSILFVFMILIFSCGYSSWIFSDVKASNQKTAAWISDQISNKVDKTLSESQRILENLYCSPWVVKCMSNAYEKNFSPYDYYLYCREIHSLTHSSSAVQSLILIFPEQDMALTGSIWGSVENCVSNFSINYNADLSPAIQQIMNADSQGIKNQLHYTSSYYDTPNHLLLSYHLETTANPRGYAVFVIDKAKLQEPVLSFMRQDPDGRLVEASLTMARPDGESHTVYQLSSKEPLSSSRTIQVEAALPGFTYSLAFHDILGQKNSNRIILLLFFIPLLVIFCIIFSYWTSIISLRPIERFLGKVVSYNKMDTGGMSLEAAESAFEDLVDENSKIAEENIRIRETAELYRSTVRNAFLVRLVRGYFMNMDEWKDIDQTLRSYDLPFSGQSHFCVSVLHDNRTQSPSGGGGGVKALSGPLQEFLTQNQINSILVELSPRETVVILADASHSQKQDVYSKIDQLLLLGGPPLAAKNGPEYSGLTGISASYHKAIAELQVTDRCSSAPRFYYPPEWQKQLVDSFRLGNEEGKNRILQTIISENTRLALSPQDENTLLSFIHKTILEIIEENALDLTVFQPGIERFLAPDAGFGRWETLIELGGALYETIMKQKAAAATSEPGQSIIRYIHDHFSESSLSLKELSDRFNLSVSAISRVVKKATGVNFLEYVTGLRMEAAKKLLFSGDYSIQTISGMVGYESTYSFRRAFERFEGIRLRDYRKKQENDAAKFEED